MSRSGVYIRFTQDNHTYIRVQIDSSRFSTTKPEMDEVTEPFSSHGRGVCLIGRHEICPLPKKRLRIGRHLGQIEKDDKHFDHRSLWIEQCQLYSTPPRYLISFLAQVEMSQVRRSGFIRLQSAEI